MIRPCTYKSYIWVISLVAGFEMRPLHIVYILLVELHFLTFTLFPMSFALLSCLTLVLDGTVVGACLDLAKLLTGFSSNGASVHLRSIQFLLICVECSVQISYDLASLAETIPTLNLCTQPCCQKAVCDPCILLKLSIVTFN